MTNDELQQALDKHHQMIASLAYGCLQRMRKPTFHSLDDLIQEGHLRCIQRLPSFDPKKAPLQTYIYRCVVTRFSDLVRGSWRKKNDDGLYKHDQATEIRIRQKNSFASSPI